MATVGLIAGGSFAASLRDAVQEAVKTNPRIEAAQANYRATLHVLDQARGRLLPEIDLAADVGKQRVDRPNGLGPLVNNQTRLRRQVTLTVRQALFDGWDRANDIYRSQARITAASHRILARSDAVALNAIEAYIDVNRHNRLLQLARGHVARHQELLSIIRQRLDGGAAPIGDLEQTLERLESARALVAQIDVAREAAIAKYKASVGSKPNRLKHVPYARNLPKSPSAVMASALVNNARIKATSSEIDIAGYDKEQFRSSLYPKLFLEGSATRGENLEGTPGSNDELKAMLVLRWRLFDGGVRQGRIAELAEREYEKVAERDILLTEIEEIVNTAWGRFTKGWAQVDALKRQSVQTKKVIATYQDEYNANKRSLLDVLDAENSNFG
ncbi:MAG: TolC family protein, partial [Pseudomonadota bacterium]